MDGKAQSRLTRFDEEMAEFEREVGLRERSGPGHNEALRLIKLCPAELKHMDAAELGEAAYTLQQFSYHLQMAHNDHLSQAKLSRESVNRIVLPKMNSFPAPTGEERRAMAVVSSDIAMGYDAARVEAEVRAEKLNFLSVKIDAMAKSLQSLAATRRK